MDFFQVVHPQTLDTAPVALVLLEILFSVVMCVAACLGLTYIPAYIHDYTTKKANSGTRSRRVARVPTAPIAAKPNSAATTIPEVKVAEIPREAAVVPKAAKVEISASVKEEKSEVPSQPTPPSPVAPDTAKSTTGITKEPIQKEKKSATSKKAPAASVAPILDDITHDFFDDETLLDEAMEYILVKKPYKEAKAKSKGTLAPAVAASAAPGTEKPADAPEKTMAIPAKSSTASKKKTAAENNTNDNIFSNKDLAKKMMNGLSGGATTQGANKGTSSKGNSTKDGNFSASSSTKSGSLTSTMKPKTLGEGPNMDDKDMDSYLDNIYNEHSILEEALLDATVESVKNGQKC